MTKRIFRSIMLVASLILLLGLGFVMGILYHYFGVQLETELKTEAEYLALSIDDQGISALDELPSDASRVTLIDRDGTVIYDNKADISKMENHRKREEVIAAQMKGAGKAVRHSSTLSEKTVYYAKELADGRILRVSSTQYTILAILRELIQPMLYVILFMTVFSGIFAARLARKIVDPINQLDLENPGSTEIYDEISPLLSKINKQQKTISGQLADARKQQEEFAIITDNMSEGLLVIDSQTELLSCNVSALKLLDAENMNTNESVLSLNRSAPFQQTVEHVLSGEHVTANLQIGERHCQMIANPVLRDEEVTGAVLLLVDITEKMQRENLRREFTANVSHELKTPLTSISGFAEIIQDGFVRPEDIKKFAGKIFDEAQRLIALVGDVIKISQLDEGCLPYQKENVDLYHMARDILDRFREPAKKAEVSLFLEGEHGEVFAVKPILEEVISNLCDNGIKYNKRGGSVIVTIQNEKNRVSISVKDTGIGIPAGHQTRIFERFYRVDKSHSKEIGGTGLGLSIVKHGAAFLEAELELESVVNEGSTFRLLWNKVEL